MKSPLTLNAALLLHVKIRNSTTRHLFKFLESNFKEQKFFDNSYFKMVLSKFSVVECSN